MKFDYLREFITVADSSQMHEAAAKMGISFSSLSKHMKALEMELGVPLFMRARKVVLTQYGRSMLSYAQELVALQDQYLLEFYSQKQTDVALTVGISSFQYKGDISTVIEHYQQSHPEQAILVKEARNTDLAQMVENGSIDLAFVRSTPELERKHDLFYFPYCVDKLVACLPVTHQCAGKESVRLEDLKGDTVFLRTENSSIYNICAREYEARGLPLKISTCGFYATYDNIRKGNGITYYMAPPPKADFGDSVVLIPVEPPIYNYVDIVVPRKKVSPQVEAFLQYIWHGIAK